jgi:hypothetical protein
MKKTASHYHRQSEHLTHALVGSVEKVAKITGASLPDVVSNEHAGIPYEARRRAYMDYVNRKAHERHSSGALATATGGLLGGAVGALAGPGGALVGGGLGAIMGYATKKQDDEDIREARAVLADRRYADDALARRMAARHTSERSYDRSMRSYEGMATRRAIRRSSRPNVRVHQYNTRIQNTNVSSTRNTTHQSVHLHRY